MEKNFLTSLKIVKTTKSPIKVNVQKVSVEESNQVASTVVDSGEDSLPVLVRLVSESGKQVKEYRIQLTKEKPVSEKTVAAVQEDLPKLEFVEKIWPTRQLRKGFNTVSR